MTVEELKSKVNELFLQARNQKLIDVEKKRLLARAMAYYNELQFAKDGKVEVDEQRVRNVQQRNMNNAALRLAEVRGELGLLADDTPERLNEDMVKEDQGASRYDNKDSEASDIAENIQQQMSSTWRVRGNSKEFNAVKRAMQAVASAKDGPTQLDNYVAAETLRMYIGKNLNKAKSAVGMTRMACALAFMKQTMPEKDFKAYCTNLNLLRRIPYTKENGELQFDLKDPRCIDPDMIGTVGEVYKTVRERFHEYAKDEEKKIDPRDLARLTALKNLQAKSSKGENLVVEHEALEAEIEKVMKDRRFQEALRTKQRDELIDMAWYGNLNKIEGYVAPLPQEQQKRIDDDRTKKEDARKQKIQSIMDIKAKQEKQVKDALDKEEKRIIEEKNRIAKEAELKKQQEELLKIQKPHSQMLREIMPEITKMADTFDSVFSQLDNDHVEQYTELAAKLVALGEIGYKNHQAKPEEKEADPTVNLGKFNERVEQLKNDKYVQQLGKH